MPIPKDILAVARPKNTFVVVYGKNKNLYAVRERLGCKYKEGRRVPVNGRTIGHIVDFKYVPIEKKIENISKSTKKVEKVDLKDWANIQLCDNLFSSVISELKQHYSDSDALKLYCIAILRVCYPDIKDCELKEFYDNSFLSELYPGVALSKNTVSKFINDIGKTCSRIISFMRARADKIDKDHHILIDGTLKTSNSKINTLSDFSRKSKIKGDRSIFVLYAYDLEAKEPVCCKCYPGNMIDAVAYNNFVQENHITKGLLVCDKGFPSSCAKEAFNANPDLHYLNPIKRNSKFIETHDLFNYTGVLKGVENIHYRKEKCHGTNKWLYSFKDINAACQEEQDWTRRIQKGKTSMEKLNQVKPCFGTIIFECDLDLEPEVIYSAYSKRWEIELVMRYYKFACGFDDTRVHDDYSVIGSEFCNFLSSLLTFKLLNKFDDTKVLNKETYKHVMRVLRRAKKIRLNQEDSEWSLININVSHEKLLNTLGLIELAD